MATIHSRTGRRQPTGRPGRRAGPWRASRGRSLRAPLRRALGNPLWCPAPTGVIKPLVRPGIGADFEPSQPFNPLHRYGVEEIAALGAARTSSPAGRGQQQQRRRRRSAGGRSRAMRGQD